MAETRHPIIQCPAFDAEPNISQVNIPDVSPANRTNHYPQLQAVGIASIPSRTLAQLQRSDCIPPNSFTELPPLIAQFLGAESVAFCTITKLFGTKQELFAAIVLIEQFLGTLPFVRRRKRSALSGIGN
jgi:hypothetical protein